MVMCIAIDNIDADSMVFSFGIGEYSFDLDLIKILI